jgi:hypothetical protein
MIVLTDLQKTVRAARQPFRLFAPQLRLTDAFVSLNNQSI